MRLLGTLVLTGALTALAPVPAAQAFPTTCHGEQATILGTQRGNVIVGTPGRDVIVGGRGNDSIRGRGGNDLICGGRGADHLDGGYGDDHVDGGLDLVYPHNSTYQAAGDQVRGREGDDVLDGGYDPRTKQEDVEVVTADMLSWGDAEKGVRVDAGAGRATGQGHDRFPTGRPVTFELGFYDDVLIGSSRGDYVYGGSGDDTVSGRGGNDTFEGGYGDDTFEGGAGHDKYRRDQGGTNTCTSVEADPNGACSVLP